MVSTQAEVSVFTDWTYELGSLCKVLTDNIINKRNNEKQFISCHCNDVYCKINSLHESLEDNKKCILVLCVSICLIFFWDKIFCFI